MIFGIGTDIVKTERFKDLKESFLSYAFTERELEVLGESPERLAGCFAAKEAVSKAFGTGIRGFGLKDIEILRNELGAPYVLLWGKAKKFDKLKIYVSITHEKEYAAAFAVAEGVLE